MKIRFKIAILGVSFSCAALALAMLVCSSASAQQSPAPAAQSLPAWANTQKFLSVGDFAGIDPTGATISTGFSTAFAAACQAKLGLYIPNGIYSIPAGTMWDFAGCPNGFKLLGQSNNGTVINVVGSGNGWQWMVSGGSGTSSTVAHQDDEFGNFTVRCDTAGVCLQLGQTSGADNFQAANIHDIIVANSNSGHSQNAVAWQLNYVIGNIFTDIQCDLVPATASVPGYGIGMQLVLAEFNTFINSSCGNANTAFQFTDLGNAGLGFNYDNQFINADIENVQNGVVIANSANSASIRNEFDHGQAYTIYPGGYLFANRQQNPSGCCGNLVIREVNNPLNPLYSGSGTSPMLDPQHALGVQVIGSYEGVTSLIPLSGSMRACSTNMVQNTTGQTQQVTVTGGNASEVCWHGMTYKIDSGKSAYTFIWEPGDSFGVTYREPPQVFMFPLH